MKEAKLRIGWSVCKVIDYVNVKRCYNCCGYNHIASKCKNKRACLKCGGEHLLKDCISDANECVNCKIAIQKFKVNIETNHPVWSRDCAVYKRKLESERKKIQYNQ